MIYSNITVTSLKAKALSFFLHPTEQEVCRWSRFLTNIRVEFCSLHGEVREPRGARRRTARSFAVQGKEKMSC